ncbi:MAG: tetratricopeptide repeat protein [Bdellovibrionaceae bacterium]|nr:tetratricopeptide repeat protein [Pseudobdellovibrionaceae bacterium]
MVKVTVIFFLFWGLNLTIGIAFATNKTNSLTQEAAWEAIITKADNQALEILDRLIKKNKGARIEPDLWMRRAELFNKKAKTARFFEMTRDDHDKALSFIPEVIKDQSSRQALSNANDSYRYILKNFKNYQMADRAVYGLAFNLEQLGLIEEAVESYQFLVKHYPHSQLVDDSYLALGEIYFNRGDFAKALDFYQKVTNNPKSKAFWYAEYKKGWVYYNLKETEEGITRLEHLLKNEHQYENRLAIQEEALKDLALFFADVRPAESAYQYFIGLPVSKESALSALRRLAAIYSRHSKHKEAFIVYEAILNSEKQPQVLSQFALLAAEARATIKQYSDANRLIEKAFLSCEAIEFKSEECTVGLDQLQTRLIKELWEENKKKPRKESSDVLENQIRMAIKHSPSKEVRAKNWALLGDFFYSSNRLNNAIDSYQRAYNEFPKELYLLAKIDAQIEMLKQENISNALVASIDVFLKNYPNHERVVELKIKRVALLLGQKKANQCEEDIKWLKKQNLSEGLREQFHELELDYLNQKGDLIALKEQALKYEKQQTDTKKKAYFAKISRLTEYKILQKSLKEAKDVKGKRTELLKMIKMLGHIQDHPDLSQAERELLLQALDVTQENQLKFFTIKLGELFAERFPKDEKLRDIYAMVVKNSFDIGDLRRVKEYSYRLLPFVSGQEKNQLVSTIVELEQVLGNKESFIKFLNHEASKLPEKDWFALLNQLYHSTTHDSELRSQIVSQIRRWKVEPIYSELQLEETFRLLNQKRFEEAFAQAKKFMGQQYPRSLRAKARLIQAKIFEKELADVGLRVSLARAPLLIEIKVERLEKAQKAYEDVLNWAASNSDDYLEALMGMERILADFLIFANNLSIKDGSDEDTKLFRSQLQVVAGPFNKKLTSIREEVEEIRKKTKKTVNNFRNSVEEYEAEETVPPLIDSKVVTLFPELINGEVPSCRSEYQKTCLVGYKSAQEIEKWLENNEGLQGLESWEMPFYRSFEAAANGRWDEAIYLLKLGQKLDEKNSNVLYQLGRVYLLKGEIQQGLNLLYQSYIQGFPFNDLKYAVIFDSYLQHNCPKALAFVPQEKVTHQVGEFLYPIWAECLSQSHQFEEALRILDKKTTEGLAKWLQIARIHEKYRQDWSEAIKSYEKAKPYLKSSSTKDWISKKLSYLRAQDQNLATDHKVRGASQ